MHRINSSRCNISQLYLEFCHHYSIAMAAHTFVTPPNICATPCVSCELSSLFCTRRGATIAHTFYKINDGDDRLCFCLACVSLPQQQQLVYLMPVALHSVVDCVNIIKSPRRTQTKFPNATIPRCSCESHKIRNESQNNS